MNTPLIDPQAPTKAEVIEHNTRIAKANFAIQVVTQLAGNDEFMKTVVAHYGCDINSEAGGVLASVAIEAAETIMSKYPMSMPVTK